MLPLGPGFCANSTDIPATLHRKLGGQWVQVDWDDPKKQEVMFDIVRIYQAAQLPVMLICHTVGQVQKAHAVFKNTIDYKYRVEPNVKEMDYIDTEEYCWLLNKLYSLGIRVWGPSFSHWRSPKPEWDTRTQWEDFKRYGGLLRVKGLSWHGYEWNPEDMPRVAKEIRAEIPASLPLCISEWGPSPFIIDPSQRADWHRRAQKACVAAKVPAALYRIAEVGDNTGFVENAGYTKPWELNAAGTALAKMVAPVTL